MADAPSEPDKKRTRQRAARACELCRAKKYRCDETYPCTHCKKLNIECVYKGDEHLRQRLHSSSYVAELEKRVQELSARVPKPMQIVQNQSLGQAPVENRIVGENYQSSSNPSRHADPNTESVIDDDESDDENEGEFHDVNAHTQNIEFHGKTSSMAFLASIQRQNSNRDRLPSDPKPLPVEKHSLVSTLHNDAFSPDKDNQIRLGDDLMILESQRYYFRQSRLFIDGYFENLHFIHPILDKSTFLTRCEDLWFGNSHKQPRAFLALYCSILSLGALVRVWEEDIIEGLNRFQWSRRLFGHAKAALGDLSAPSDIEIIQCLIFMAKVCQNEHNPNMAYMYLGWATRACLSAGFNREPPRKQEAKEMKDMYNAITKTWWGLYSLEMEMSFSLGRPDSLGWDDYHNRKIPSMDGTELDILAAMIPFARITRKVSICIYLSQSSVHEKVDVANQIEKEMDAWAKSLPAKISPLSLNGGESKMLKDPKWARRQRLVLRLRYFNVRMVLYRPFLLFAARSSRRLPSTLEKAVQYCVEAAKGTIELMHETFVHHVFFRTWWYNTTYTLYAASIILCYATQVAAHAEKENLFRLMDKVIEVLEAMDESTVARKTADMFKQTVVQARDSAAEKHNVFSTTGSIQQTPSQSQTSPLDSNSLMDMQMPSMNMDFDFDFTNASLGLDDMQYLLWNDWTGQTSGFGP